MGCLLGSADSEKNQEEQTTEQEKLKESPQPFINEPEWSSAHVAPMRNSPSNHTDLSGNWWSMRYTSKNNVKISAPNPYHSAQAAPNILQNHARNSVPYASLSSQTANLYPNDYPSKNSAKFQMNPSEFPALPTYQTPTQKNESKLKTNKWNKYSSDYVPLDSDYSCFFDDTSSYSSTTSSTFTQYKPVSNLKTVANYKNLSINNLERKSSLNQRQTSKPTNKNINQSQKPIKLNGNTSDSSVPSKVYSEFITFILSYCLYMPKSEPLIIPNSFKDISNYINYFGSAFYTELSAILDQALEEAFLANKYRLHLHSEDSYASLSPSCSNELKFENEIQINDIVIIIPNQNSFPTNFEEIKENNIHWTLGLVDQNKANKINILLNPGREARLKSSGIYIAAIIGNITSLKRELSVLDKIKRFSLLSQILSPQIYELRPKCRLSETIQNKYNQSQLEAIVSSIGSEGKISLIQGPPGTGKTRTVAGILSGLYAASKNIRVLICAQSNAAVDEIAWTVLKEGILDSDGNKRSDISLLRIGEKRQKHELGVGEDIKASKEIELGINSIKINVLVEEKLNKEDLYDPTFKIKELIEKLEKKEKQLKELVEKRANYHVKEIEIKIEKLSFKVDCLKAKKTEYFSKKTIYMAELIRTADVMFCTLSGAGSMVVVQNISSINYLIIDEACQSLELSALIPFQYNPKSAILIGDPKQLPATTFSSISKTNKYDRSLFERIMKCNIRPLVLSVQYRMAKEISDFISKTFYQNQIQCSKSVISRKIPNWIYPTGLLFFNLETSEETKAEDSLSYYNEPEADFVLKLYALLRNRICNMNARIGIISPYKGQVQYIEYLLYEKFGNSWKKHCEVSSVDGFQGREVDLVILSSVRSEGIGFLRDERRMNVAISRAKYGMYAIGNEICLSSNPKWRSLIEYCKELNKYESCSYFKDVTMFFNNTTYY